MGLCQLAEKRRASDVNAACAKAMDTAANLPSFRTIKNMLESGNQAPGQLQMELREIDPITRDASGQIIGTATTRPSSSGSTQTTYRDASGRLAGSASSQGTTSGGSSTTYRDASGRLAGSASTHKSAGTSSSTQFRDASGRLSGSETINGSSAGAATSTKRDASGRLIGSSSGSGKCPSVVRVPSPPAGAKK